MAQNCSERKRKIWQKKVEKGKREEMRENVQSKTKMWTALLEALITAIFSASKVDVVKKW